MAKFDPYKVVPFSKAGQDAQRRVEVAFERKPTFTARVGSSFVRTIESGDTIVVDPNVRRPASGIVLAKTLRSGTKFVCDTCDSTPFNASLYDNPDYEILGAVVSLVRNYDIVPAMPDQQKGGAE